MNIITDSFRTYDASGALRDRFFPFKQVNLATISSVQYAAFSGSALAYYHTGITNRISYQFDFHISSVTSFPFYLAGIRYNTVESQTAIYGACVLAINSDRTLTIVSPDSQNMTSTNAEAAISTWKSDPIIELSGGLNRVSVYFDLSNTTLSDNAIWINNRLYEKVPYPSFTPTGGYGIVIGDPRNRARTYIKDLIYRTDTATFTPYLIPHLSARHIKPSATMTGQWTPTGSPTNWEAASGVGDSGRNETSSNAIDMYHMTQTTNVGMRRLIYGVQVNTKTSGASGSLSGIIAASGGQTPNYFNIPTSNSSVYTATFFDTSPFGGSWTQNQVDNLKLGIRYNG